MNLRKTSSVIDHRSRKIEAASNVLTGRVDRTQVAEVFEVFRKTVRAALACTVSAPVLLYERRCIDHEQGVSAEHHVLRERAKRRFVARPRVG